MCMTNPLKAAPYAVGGLLGGSVLKSVFGKKKDTSSTSSAAAPAATSSAGGGY